MPDRDFAQLRLQLLRAGIAPAYAERTALELADHWADLEEAAARSGLTAEQAEQWADQALGSEATILAAAIARPELKAWTERWPRANRCLRSLVSLGTLPLLPFALCVDRGEVIARWSASVALASLVTGSMFLSLNWLILA